MSLRYVTYSSNNSGGNWWLSDDDWKALERAGWIVNWGQKWFCPPNSNWGDRRKPDTAPEVPCQNCKGHHFSSSALLTPKDRWLGCFAHRAHRPGLTLHEAVEEWERVTGQSATAVGCPCCGQPHTFTEYDENGNYVTSGPKSYYEARW